MGLLCPSLHSPPPTGPAPEVPPQLPLQEGVNRKRPAPGGHRSPLFSGSASPPPPGRPCGEPLPEAGGRLAVSPGCGPARREGGREGGSGRGNAPPEGLGHSCHPSLRGFPRRGPAAAPRGGALPHGPIWKPEGFDPEPPAQAKKAPVSFHPTPPFLPSSGVSGPESSPSAPPPSA